MRKTMGWGLRLRTLLTGVMILLACQVGEVLAAAQIKSVRIWRAPDNTRLVFDLSGPVQHSLFTLAAPNRIVIDVSGAQLATQLNGLKLGNTPITEIARKKGADLFVSIHADAAPSRSAFGASVFALSDRGATSETARWLADSENRSDLIGGDGSVSLGDKDQMLAGVLLDLSMTATLSSSLDVGHKVLTNVGRITSLHKRRVEQAGFMVLKSPDIPSILVETGFISNVNESRKLASASHQQALARSITSGIRQYFQQSPPPGTYIASLRAQGKLSMGPREHVVRPGETLAMIAQRYEVSMAALRSSNSLPSDNLKVGQALSIPSTALAAQ